MCVAWRSRDHVIATKPSTSGASLTGFCVALLVQILLGKPQCTRINLQPSNVAQDSKLVRHLVRMCAHEDHTTEIWGSIAAGAMSIRDLVMTHGRPADEDTSCTVALTMTQMW